MLLLFASAGCMSKDADMMMNHVFDPTAPRTGQSFDDALAALRKKGDVTIVEDRKFGTPPPPESKDADRLLRRVTVTCTPPGGKTDQYDFDLDGRGNVMRYTAILR